MQLPRCGVLLIPLFAAAAYAQNTAPRIAGKPNLNGIWQAMTTANWDLEDHPAQAGPAVQLGAIDATPAGYGVVEGGTIPYKPEALAKKKENFANRVKLDPEVKCYMPGVPRATYGDISALEALRAKQSEIRSPAAKHGAGNLRVFGRTATSIS